MTAFQAIDHLLDGLGHAPWWVIVIVICLGLAAAYNAGDEGPGPSL